MRRHGILSRRSYPLISILLASILVLTSLPAGLLADDLAPPPLDPAPPLAEAPGEPAVAVPPAVATGEATEITYKGAVLNGLLTDPGSAGAVLLYFEWGTDTGYGNATERRILVHGEPFALPLGNLQPGAAYHYRAVAIGRGVGTVYGDDMAFTTAAAPAGAEPVPAPLQPAPASQARTTAQAAPDRETRLKSATERITVTLPPGAVSAPVEVELIERRPQGSTGRIFLSQFELNARLAGSGEKLTRFNKDIGIAIQHDPAELAGLDLDTLRLYYLDETTLQWLPVNGGYDRGTGLFTAAVDHFTRFGQQADPLINGPGRVMAAQVSLQSGSATFSYPIELVPGRGGFQPPLQLTYNSASVDEMKNKRSMGSWVGVGWTLSFGSISYDPALKLYHLDLNGSSYQLVSSEDGTYWTTNPEVYLKITRFANYWQLHDRDGWNYRYGYNADSRQYAYDPTDGQYTYRWDLDMIHDLNSNLASITYVQDIIGNAPNQTVRSAYPASVAYDGLGVVTFNSSFDIINDPVDRNLRRDNPRSTAANPAPKVMENRKLDSIEVKYGTTLVRQYDFAYTTTDPVLSTDYDPPDGIFYSGKHTLQSITQVGADGLSTLPAMTFTSQDREVYRHTAEGDYPGNPGNPASIYWPYLTQIDSGYGGSISFTYEQKPAPPVNDVWTRQVVASKTVSPGIGLAQTTTYLYSDGPKHLGMGWDQKYRGFGEVRETDAALDYVKHFFYTTGTVNGEDADKLTGREYRTQWFSSLDALLHEKTYDWNWVNTRDLPEVKAFWSSEGYGDGLVHFNANMAISSDRYLYVTGLDLEGVYDRVQKFDEHGNFILAWGSPGSGDGQFHDAEGTAVSPSGYVYVVDRNNHRVQQFTSGGTFIRKWGRNGGDGTSGVGDGEFHNPSGIAVAPNGHVYVADGWNHRIQEFDASGGFIRKWGRNGGDGSAGSGNGEFNWPIGVAVSPDGSVYATDRDNYRVQKFDQYGSFLLSWGGQGTGDYGFNPPLGIAVSPAGYVYVADGGNYKVKAYDLSGVYQYELVVTQYGSWAIDVAVSADSLYSTASIPQMQERIRNWAVRLAQVDETSGSKTSRTRYVYDDYGNVVTEYRDGDISTSTDNSTVYRQFFPNTYLNILGKVVRERVYQGAKTADDEVNLKAQTHYYYDDNASYTTPPAKGNLTRLEQSEDASTTVSSYFTYDSWGNKLSETDPGGNMTTWSYDAAVLTYPASKTYAMTGLIETYEYEYGTTNLLTLTDVNGQVTSYEYDTFKRLRKAIKPGDSPGSPSVEYQYVNWGTINQQHIKVITRIDGSASLWQSRYFDGVGRTVQTHEQGETGQTVISGTTAFNNRGQVDREYVSQVYDSAQVSGYKAPEAGWKYAGYFYDGLGRVEQQVNADSTWVTHELSVPWQDAVTDENLHDTTYLYDAFQRLLQVSEAVNDWRFDDQLGSYRLDHGLVYSPAGVATDAQGNVYVSDINSNRVQKLDSSGAFIAKWGSYGTGDGQFNSPYGIAVDSQGFVYVADRSNNRIQKFDPAGVFVARWGSYGTGDGQFSSPYGIAVDSQGYVYVADTSNNRIQKFDSNGAFVTKWGSYGSGDGQFKSPQGLAVDQDYVYVADTYNHRIQKFTLAGAFRSKWGTYGTADNQFRYPRGVAVDSQFVYVTDTNNHRIQRFTTGGAWQQTWGSQGSGEGQLGSPWGIAASPQGDAVYVGDMDNHRLQKFTSTGGQPTIWGSSVTGDGQYNQPRDVLVDPAGNIYVADTYNHRIQKFLPNGDFIRQWGTCGAGNDQFNYPSSLAADAQEFLYVADRGNHRIMKFNSIGQYQAQWGSYGAGQTQFSSPSGVAVYGSYVYVADTGNHRIVKYTTGGAYVAQWGSYGTASGQFKSPEGVAVDSEGRIYVADTGNHRIQVFTSPGVYEAGWGSFGVGDGQFKSPKDVWWASGASTYLYVADSSNNRVQAFQKISGSWAFSSKWGAAGSLDGQMSYPAGLTRDSQGRVYVADTSNGRVQRFKYISSSVTNYSYDVLGNLTGVVDANGNTTSIVYNWLSRKTSMSDPDMGAWSYTYYPAGQLWTQTDAKGQTITFSYDALGRQTLKDYPPGAPMMDIVYSYDDATGGNYGKGRRTGMIDDMSDASHPATFKYDARGRLVEDKRWAYSDAEAAWGSYATSFTYDGLDRIATVTYPTGEVVTSTYNGRGLPYGVSGTAAGSVVTSTLYNQLGATTEANLGSGARTTYGYYGTGGAYDTTGGFYGRLWEIKTVKTPTTHQDIRCTWDAGGNLTQRYDVTNGTTETFAYDALDRLVSATGPYSERWVYDEIGNIISRGTDEYSYGSKPHAVTSLTGFSYTYDANGNMTNRGSQVITWDVENRPRDIGTAFMLYDGDGKRIRKTEGGQTILYIGRYYEKNLTSGEVATYYYLGDRMAAKRAGTTLTYLHQDSLGSTSVITDSSGAKVASSRYYPYGGTWSASGTLPAQRFTGQRLDETGLYYYNARYYDANLGRFISADTIVPNPADPQSLNRYSYVNNNPLKYVDPSGHFFFVPFLIAIVVGAAIGAATEAAIQVVDNLVDGRGAFEDFSWKEVAIGAAIGGATAALGGIPLVGGAISAAAKPLSRAAGRLLGGVANKASSALSRLATEEGGFVRLGTEGKNLVYRSLDSVTGKVNYVGITNNLERRMAEHLGEGIKIRSVPGLANLSRADARAVEQALIEHHGLQVNGGTLINKINSISRLNPIHESSVERGVDLLRRAGYPGF